MSTQVPIPYSGSIISSLVTSIVPYDQSMEGGLNVFTETIPANSTVDVYKQLNPYRKTLTLINQGTVDLSLIIKDRQNNVNRIPLKANGGGYSFVAIKRGSIQQCINGLTLEQDIVSCEYQGLIVIENATGTNVTNLLIIESV